MTAASKRIRMITFRVSDEEFEALKSLYPAAGARSVSDLARCAIERLLTEAAKPNGNGNGNGNGHALEAKLQDLDVRVRLLDREVARLTRLLSETPHA